MRKIEDSKDQKMFQTIQYFVKAGGNIKQIKKMAEFCHKYEIDMEKLSTVMQKEDPNDILVKLRRVGLLN